MLATSIYQIADRIAEKIVKSKQEMVVYVAQSGDVRCSHRANVNEIPAFRIVGTYKGSDLGFLGVDLHEDLAQTLSEISRVKGGAR